mgnify:FL=1
MQGENMLIVYGDENTYAPLIAEIMFDGGYTVGEDTGKLGNHMKANAEFIVRACNSHDELLEAIRAILFQVYQGKVLERDACINQARAAIAKAEI